MSTTVDQRVVEMRFDNKNFEQNVSHTMSTLEKLKQKLNLTGTSKGIQELDTAARKVNMSGLAANVETVSARFSAMQVVGVTALANIANEAVNTGKRMISALTIDPVKTGFQEYETQINAVQTILANTSAKGTTIDQVNEALETLNTYADKTIYNFTEMTRNIGTFTAAGVDLDTSVNAIQGIANLAAVSGSTSQQASTAMYQLSQALASGTVKLMDWNSVVNAGMGGEVFQNALKETARAHGVAIDDMIKKQGSFRETLSDGWLTSEILTETLQKFTLTTEGLTDAQIEQNRAMLRAKGYTDDQIEEIFKLGATATDAATKVKTFTQLWDVMKESAQSGWSQTWKLIIGDFEQAKGFLTPLADFFTGALNKMSEARNNLIEGALGKNFRALVDNVKNIANPVKGAADSVKDMVKNVSDYAAVVDDIINGSWGTGQERWNKLAEAGYDWAHAQNLVNEKLGSGVRHATDYKEATEGAADANKKAADSSVKLSEEDQKRLARLAHYNEETLKGLGYSEEQIASFKELLETADKLGISVEELLANIDQIDGRWILFDSFKNIGQSIVGVFKAIGKAYRETFPAMKPDQLFDIIAALHRFSEAMKLNNGTAEKITRTFKGLFAIIDLVTTLVGGGLKIAFKLISSVLKYFNLDILDVTAAIGDALVGFRDWVDGLFDVSGILDVVVPTLRDGAKAVMEWIASLKKSKSVQAAIDAIKNAFEYLKNIDLRAIGSDIWDGLISGLVTGAGNIVKTIIEVASNLITAFCDLLGIHSPSTVFIAIGGFIIAGLIQGIREGLVSIPGTFGQIIDKCIQIFESIDWGTVFAIGLTAASVMFIKKIADALETLAAPFEGLSEIFEATAKAIKSVSKIGSATANNINAKALRNLVISLGILAAIAVGLIYFFDKYDGSAWAIVGAGATIAILAGVLIGMAWAIGKISDASVDIDAKSKKLSVKGLRNSLIPLAVSLLIVAAAVKLISTMSVEEGVGAFAGLALIVGAMLGFFTVFSKLNSGIIDADIDKIGTLMLRLSVAMLLMVGVAKLAGKLSPDELKKGALFAGGFALLVLAMIGIHRLVGERELSKLGGMMIKLAFAMGLMVGICKLVNVLELKDVVKGTLFATAFVLFVKALVWATTVGTDRQIAKLGGLLLSISISMALMVGVCKLAGMLDAKDMMMGALFMGAFVLFVKGLVWATKIGSDQELAKVSIMMLSLSLSVGILALVATAMGLIPLKNLAKGVAAIGFLSMFMAGMIYASRGVNDIKGNLIVMAVAIGLMAVALAGLSFIPDTKKLIAAAAAMGILMGMFAVMTVATKKVEKSVGTLLVMTVAIGVMAGVLWLLSTLEVQSSIRNATALGILMLAVSGAMLILSKTNTTISDALKAAIGLTAMALPLTLFANVLGKMENLPSALKNSAILSGLMLAMTGILALLGVIGKFGMTALVGVGLLTLMAVPMVAFVGVLALMQNVDGAIANATAMTKLMTVMTGLLAAVTVISILAVNALIGVGLLTLMAVPMIAFVGVLAVMQNIQNAEDNATLLISLMTVMVDLMTRLAIIGPLAVVGEVALVGLIGIMGAVGLLVAAIGKLDEMSGGGLTNVIDRGLPLLIKLAEGMGTMIGKFAGAMIEGVGESIVSLMETLKEASVHAAGIDASSFDGVKALLGVLGDLGLTMVGTSFADIFTLGGTSIDKFRTDGVAFFKALSAISDEMVNFNLPDGFSSEGVTSLLDILKTISSYSISSSWKELFQLGDESAMEKFKNDGKAFFKAIKEISSEMVGFSFPEDFSSEGLTTLLTALKNVSTTMVGVSFGDMFSKMVGDEGAIEKFKTDGKAFFQAIREISVEMTGFTLPEDFSTESLTTLLGALKSVAWATTGISFADLFANMVGDEGSMEKFQTDGVAFFKAIKGISGEMTGFAFPADFSLDGLTTLLNTLKTIGSYSVGSSWKDLFTLGDENGVEKFGNDGKAFFSAIKSMGTTASEISTESFTNASTAVNKIKEILTSIVGIDYSGVEEFTGIGTGGFGADGPMHDIAVAIKDFGTQVAGVDLEALNTAVTAAGKLRTVISNLAGLDTSGVATYKQAINDLSEISLDGFIKSFNVAIPNLTLVGTNMINALVSGIQSGKSRLMSATNDVVLSMLNSINSKRTVLSSAGSSMIEGLTTGMRAKQSSIANFVNNLMTQLVASVRNKVTVFGTTGSELMSAFAKGMTTAAPKTSTAMTTAIASALNTSNGYYNSFYSAGSYLVDGFTSGISANAYKAAAQAAAMATAAKEAAEEALGINSPSKVFYGIGEFSGMGLINALRDYGSKVYSAGADMADNARSGLSDAIGKVKDLINGDVDMNPTITPVLDLSNVQAGVGAINGMFGSSVGLSANIGAISAGMNGIQNGSNDDVIDAIDKLRNSLSNIGGNTYNSFNGVTLGDDAAVTEAFETIVRAAQMGRRV